MLTRSISPVLPLLAIALGACTQAAGSSEEETTSAENAVTSNATSSFVAETRFAIEGKPTRRLRAKIQLASNVDSSSVNAYHNTTYDEGSFQHDSCVTTILFPGSSAVIEVLDDAETVLASYTKPLTLGAGFESPTDQGSTCAPHGYADLSQGSTLSIDPDALSYPDGSKLEQIHFSFDVHVEAVRQGASWKLTSATLDPYAYSNLNHSASFHAPPGGAGGLGFTPVYEAGKRSPHTVVGRVDVASCALTDPYDVAGDPQNGTFHFAFDYRRKLESGAKVFVKYDERLGFTQSPQPEWSDTKEIELARSGTAWTGEITLTGSVRPVKGYPNETERDAVSEPGAPSSLLYVFRILHADGSQEWENGSGAKWGNYRTTGNQGGRHGYYGFLLPASCDGLGRTADLAPEIDVHP